MVAYPYVSDSDGNRYLRCDGYGRTDPGIAEWRDE